MFSSVRWTLTILTMRSFRTSGAWLAMRRWWVQGMCCTYLCTGKKGGGTAWWPANRYLKGLLLKVLGWLLRSFWFAFSRKCDIFCDTLGQSAFTSYLLNRSGNSPWHCYCESTPLTCVWKDLYLNKDCFPEVLRSWWWRCRAKLA